MRKRILGILTVIILAGLSAYAASPQTICPICKGSINKSLHVDYDGKRIYFGCAGCPEKFMEHPDKYMAEMKAEGVELESAPAEKSDSVKSKTTMQHDHKTHAKSASHIQTKCPNTGNPVNYSIYADASGKRVYFCSKGCKADFLKAPEKKLAAMEKKGLKFENSPAIQTKCPCGEELTNHKVFSDVDGKRVFFCGAGCKAKFMKNPKENLARCEKKGMKFEAAHKK
jgi:YHS domain-containing protein